MADSLVDQVSIEAQCQGLSQDWILKGWCVAEQRDVTDHQGRTLPFAQTPLSGHAIQSQALILVDGVREQNIHFAASHRAEQGGGIAEVNQIQPCVAGRGSPVLLKGLQALLHSSEVGQFVSARSDEAVVEKTIPMILISPGGYRGQVGGGEEILKRA
ncbi:MAG: Uncharacterised protein [Synechococcus sp. MIT S9220]|nr:MAG: Uncharacterised protein [Synechococcus sp. MIT S9220]